MCSYVGNDICKIFRYRKMWKIHLGSSFQCQKNTKYLQIACRVRVGHSSTESVESRFVRRRNTLLSTYVNTPPGDMANHGDNIFGKYIYLYVKLLTCCTRHHFLCSYIRCNVLLCDVIISCNQYYLRMHY